MSNVSSVPPVAHRWKTKGISIWTTNCIAIFMQKWPQSKTHRPVQKDTDQCPFSRKYILMRLHFILYIRGQNLSLKTLYCIVEQGEVSILIRRHCNITEFVMQFNSSEICYKYEENMFPISSCKCFNILVFICHLKWSSNFNIVVDIHCIMFAVFFLGTLN